MFEWIFTHSPFIYLTQSLWRDESFSVLMAEKNVFEILSLSVGDYTPPLYYLLLKIWMLFFGRGEESIRMLSFVFYIFTIWIGYKFAKEIIPIKNKWFAPVTTILFALNPMLLYYAFEARTYSLVAFLVLCSLYFFMKRNWKWYVVSSVLALYAHPYSLLALAAQGLYILVWDRKIIKTFVKKSITIAALYLPWLVVIFMQITRSAEMWYYPVTQKLTHAILGSMYLGFEGTPDRLWEWCTKLSVIIFGIITFSFFNNNIKHVQRLLFVSVMLPLVLVLGISFIKPIFTQRYLIFVTISEILIISCGLFSLSNKWIRTAAITVTVVYLLYFNSWYPSQNTKRDFQATFIEINEQMKKEDVIVNESALTFFNAEYYATYPERVYLLRKDDSPLPSYVGPVLIPREKWVKSLPEKTRTFLLKEDATYETIIY